MWDGRVQYNLHLFPLDQHLGLIASMPDSPDTWPPFRVPASMATREQLEAFLNLVYDHSIVSEWASPTSDEAEAASVVDLLAVVRLSDYFQFDALAEECENELDSRFEQGEMTLELVELWRFLAGSKNDRLRALALTATARCLQRNYKAAKAQLVNARLWETVQGRDWQRMFELACRKKARGDREG